MGSADPFSNGVPDTYYRVSAKALIFDGQGRLLVAANRQGKWEIPGGGWDHGETFAECIARELWEELRAKVSAISEVNFAYRGVNFRGDPKVSLAARVQVEGDDFTPMDDDLAETRFVTREEFLRLPFQESEKSVVESVDKIWSLPAES